MSDYIQSNNDSGNLALYAGIGLAGAAGGAALAYRATRDPSNGKTAATGKPNTSTNTSTNTSREGKKMGMLARLFGGKPEGPSNTIDAGKLVVNPDLSKSTSTEIPNVLSDYIPSGVRASTATIPGATTAATTASPEPVIKNPLVTGVETRYSADDVLNGNHQATPLKKRKQVAVKNFTATEAVSSNIDLSGVEQSVQARRGTGKKRSKKGGKGGKRSLYAYLK